MIERIGTFITQKIFIYFKIYNVIKFAFHDYKNKQSGLEKILISKQFTRIIFVDV